MARHPKPFRDRNPVVIGAVSLSVIARAGAAGVQRPVPAVHRRRHGVLGAVLRGGGAAPRRPGPHRRRQGRPGRGAAPGGRRGDRRVPGRGRLRRRPVPGRHPHRDGAGRQVPGAGAAGRRGARPRRPDPAGAHRLALRRRRGLRRPVHHGRGDRHRSSSPTSFEVLADDVRRDPRRGAGLAGGPGAALGHHRLPGRRARASAVGDPRRHRGPRRPQRRVHPADRGLQHPAGGGPGAAAADRLDPDQHPAARRPADRARRRQPRGAHPGAAAAGHGDRHPVPQPGRPRGDRGELRPVRPGLHQHARQRPVVRQLRGQPAPGAWSPRSVCGGDQQVPGG